jgi:hypothetical protein
MTRVPEGKRANPNLAGRRAAADVASDILVDRAGSSAPENPYVRRSRYDEGSPGRREPERPDF